MNAARRNLHGSPPGDPTPGAEADAVRWLEAQDATMLARLADRADIDSGSCGKLGVDAVGARIAAFLAKPDVSVVTLPVEG